MKIICTDNFNRENVDESVVAENIKSETHAKVMAEGLNAKFSGDHSQDYFVVRPDDYKPYRFEP